MRQGFVEREQFAKVLAELTPELRDFVEWLGVTGMRVGEAKRLEWAHVHRDGGGGLELRIPAELTKNRQPRVLPLVGSLGQVIARRRDARRLDCRFVFHRDGNRIKDFRAAWASACRRAGVPTLLVHDLRRSAVRSLVMQGVDQAIAQRITGHRTASVFQRYRICSTVEVADALRRLEQVS